MAEIFKINGIKLTTEGNQYGCRDCYFNQDDTCKFIDIISQDKHFGLPDCTLDEIIFKEVKE